MVHRKTRTLYKIINTNDGSNSSSRRSSSRLQSKIQLEWKAVRQFPVKDARDKIRSFTSDYFLTTNWNLRKSQIQCIQSGRIAQLSRCFSDGLSMVLNYLRIEKIDFLDSTRQSIEFIF